MNDRIQEIQTTLTVTDNTLTSGDPSWQGVQTTGCYQPYAYQTLNWNHYPVYICTDKTKKAIEVLKALQADKMLTCNSVPRFIELVEKIAGLL